MSVKQKLAKLVESDQNALERALIALDDANVWKTGLQEQRGKYLSHWLRSGKSLSGKFIKEAQNLVLAHLDDLVCVSLQKTKNRIASLEQQIVKLKEWEQEIMAEGEIDLPQKSIWETCFKEGLY